MELANEEKINEVADQLKSYSKIRLELFKLRAIEKAAVSGAYLITRFILFAALGITLVFLSIAAAFYLSQLVGSIISGFAMVGAFYLLVSIVLLLLRKKVLEARLRNRIIYTLSDING